MCLLKITKNKLWNQFIYDETREMREKVRWRKREGKKSFWLFRNLHMWQDPGWALDLNNNSSSRWNVVMVGEFRIHNGHIVDPVTVWLYARHVFSINLSLCASAGVQMFGENSFFFLQFSHIILLFFCHFLSLFFSLCVSLPLALCYPMELVWQCKRW